MQKETQRKRKILSGIGFVLTVAVIAFLLFFFLKDTILELRRLTEGGDDDGIREFFRSKGWLGYLTVVIVEALEMIVICLPAELIQFPAGISFPIPIAILLCDLGVTLGASVIYALVSVFKVKPLMLGKREKKIAAIEKSSGGVKTQILMYFLFVTPIIPFGAICYYASGKKISFGRYLFTCSTGVLPSIVTSIIMGTGARYFIANSIPIWQFILLVFFLGMLLFLGMYFIGRKFLSKPGSKNSPESFLYKPLLGLFGVFVKLHSKAAYVEDERYEEMFDIDGPILFLCNHKSVYDIYHTLNYIYPIRAALVGNRYYMRNKVSRFAMRALGFIPKRMFTTEIEPIVKIRESVGRRTSVFLYPEARLSLDGKENPIASGTGALVKRLGIPVVLLNINGDYAAYSKFHTTKGRIPVEVKVNGILYPQDIENLDAEQINGLIRRGLQTDEYEYLRRVTIRDKNIAADSEKVIYKCPACHRDFTTRSERNRLYCDCGFSLTFDKHYSFEENPYGFADLSDAYRRVKELERAEADACGEDFRYELDVTVKVLDTEDRKRDLCGEGRITLTRAGIRFIGTIDGAQETLTRSFDELPCLAFGVDDEFEFYHRGRLCYFYPKENKRACTKISTLYDVLCQAGKEGREET